MRASRSSTRKPTRPKAAGVRGACPPELCLTSEELGVLKRLEVKLKKENPGLILHPLMWRIPLPTGTQYSTPILDQFVKHGWTAPVILVQQGKTKLILTDAYQLKLWLGSRRPLTAILPATSQRMSDAEALRWHLTNNIPRTWPVWRRALAAAAMAGVAHEQFAALKTIEDLDPKKAGVKDVLAKHTDVSPRQVQYALLQLRRRADRFRRALWGTAKLFSVKRLIRGVPPGSGARKGKLTPLSYGDPNLKTESTASLAIIDLELVDWQTCGPKDIVPLMRRTGSVVILGKFVNDRMKKFVQDLNQALPDKRAPYQKLGCLKILDYVKKKRGKAASPKHRQALVLYRDCSLLPGFSKVTKRNLRKEYALLKRKRVLESSETITENLNRRQARILVYQELMHVYAYPEKSPVFATCLVGNHDSKHKAFLSCLKSAAHRSDRPLLTYSVETPAV